jgi:hypothetical protein
VSGFTYRCESCDNNRAVVIHDGEDALCVECQDVCGRSFFCHTCDTRLCVSGTDHCLECIADAVVEDPRELECLTDDLVLAVTCVLAERLRPFLRQRQAA